MPGVKRAQYEGKYGSLIEKHVHSLEWIRAMLLDMDSLIDPVMGIRSWDDAAVIGFGGKRLVASVDGPYAKRLVLKSALVHSATDVVVKGAKPLFALDALTGGEDDVREMLLSLREQALAMSIPILGGNTRIDAGVEPGCSLTVIGELLTAEPVRDCGACRGDCLVLIGEPVWGGRRERIEKAKALFLSWFRILGSGADIHASKDVTKGGLISAVYEICRKSGRDYEFREDIPFSLTRNLDNFLICVSGKDMPVIEKICRNSGIPCHIVGAVI